MTTTSPSPESSQAASPTPRPQRLFVIAVIAAALGLVITLSFGYADRDPEPHDLRLAVAADAPIDAKVAAELKRAQPGGFDVVVSANPADATRSVRSQSTAGALLVPVRGPVTIVTAGAEGAIQKGALTIALTAVAASLRRSTQLFDVAPLRDGDRAGLSSFVFSLGLLIPSVLGALGIFLFGMQLRLWWRVAAGTLFALFAACGGVLAIDAVLGALTGAGAALIGIGFLGALSFVLFVAALQAVVGLPGTGLAAITFIFVGNAISGGSVPVGFLPDGFRQIAPWLPNNAIVRATRDRVYFNGHDLGHPLLVLGLWPIAAMLVLGAVDLLHLSERRREPHNAHEIYRTPALVHVSRRLAARRARTGEVRDAGIADGGCAPAKIYGPARKAARRTQRGKRAP